VSHHPEIDPAEALARLARINFARNDLTQVLGTIAGLARDSVTAPDDVSITLMTQGTGTTAAFTGDRAMALDEQQYDRGYGPCLDACDAGEILSVDDTATEQRWPAFTKRALELGVHSSLSIPLPIQDTVTGALNLYSVTVRAFDDDAVRAATIFAEYAAVAVANAHSYESATTLVERMRHAARTRAIIDQAKGILMGRHAMTTEAALDVLILAARRSGRPLRDVADAVVTESQAGAPGSGDADLPGLVETIRLSASSEGV
jgi:GAF domain-containing protein